MKPWAKRHWAYLLFLAALLPGGGGCERREEAKMEPRTVGNVHASGAYITYFGEPPTVDEGTCYAMVGFFPLAGQSGKVSPFPLFMFNRESQMQVMTEQLLQWGEGWDMGGVAHNPFPPGTELYSLTKEQDLVRVELSPVVLTATDDRDKRLILAALGHTLSQFEGVRRVMVVAGGELLPFQSEHGFFPDVEAVVPPGAPQVLSVAGVWEAGRADPEELSIFFDRPVTVDKVRVTIAGRRLEGDYFRSVFDMAVVVRPQQPEELRAGLPVTVAWRVEDRLGRRGEGEKTFALQRIEHP